MTDSANVKDTYINGYAETEVFGDDFRLAEVPKLIDLTYFTIIKEA